MVTRVGDGVYRVETDGRSDLVYVAGSSEALWAFCNGSVFRQNVGSGSSRTGSGQPGVAPGFAGALAKAVSRTEAGQPAPLTAPMPGTVLRILVSRGEKVATDQPVVILEAMKMEIPLRALDEAVVSAVRCREGELVQADAVLVTFEAAP
jgi:biotin carboxyl carrier protein